MGLECLTFALRGKHPNLRLLLVWWLVFLPLSLKVVGSCPIHSVLQLYWIELCLWVTADKD